MKLCFELGVKAVVLKQSDVNGKALDVKGVLLHCVGNGLRRVAGEHRQRAENDYDQKEDRLEDYSQLDACVLAEKHKDKAHEELGNDVKAGEIQERNAEKRGFHICLFRRDQNDDDIGGKRSGHEAVADPENMIPVIKNQENDHIIDSEQNDINRQSHKTVFFLSHHISSKCTGPLCKYLQTNFPKTDTFNVKGLNNKGRTWHPLVLFLHSYSK